MFRSKIRISRFLGLVCTAVMIACGTVTASAATATVSYLDADRSVKTANATLLDQDAGPVLRDSWYAVQGRVRFDQQLVVGSGSVHLILCNGAQLMAEGGILIPEGRTLMICAQSEGDRAGFLFAAPMEGAGIGGPENGNGGSLMINGGRIEAIGGEASAGIGGARRGSMTSITINGGTVKATSWFPSRAGMVNTGLDVHAAGTADSGAGIGAGYKGGSPRITINGGTVEAKGYIGNAGIGGSESSGGGGIEINGGTVKAVGGRYGAGIGGGDGTASGSIRITGGTVTAAGVRGGAGIGGGRNNGNQADPIEISGGNVTALALNDIQQEKDDPTVNIDGKVYYYGSGGGSGIGGGYEGKSGNVTISGGTVHAIGGGGAGIGSGLQEDMADGSTILISGGDITAASFGGAAGIGAGSSGNAKTIKVTGGTVRAYGSSGGASSFFDSFASQASSGIGGGQETHSYYGGEGGTFIYEGGTVIACAGLEYNTAIGRGYNDREMGTVQIGAGAKVSGTNNVSDYSAERQISDTPRTPLQTLEIAETGSRIGWCNRSRYVVIEKCNHKGSDDSEDSFVRYVDTDASQHYVSGKCTFCGLETNRYERHVFDPVTHECVCGHREVPVTFYDDAGAVVLATQYVAAGRRPAKMPAEPEPRMGYRFEGYFERNENGTPSGTAFSAYRLVTGKMDLYQVWTRTAPDYTVRFFDENGSRISWKSRSGEEISEVTVMGDTYLTEAPPIPVRQGYRFAGYYEKNGNDYIGEAFSFSKPVTKSYDLYRRWEVSNSEWVYIEFDSDGGTPVDPLTVLRNHTCSETEWPADPQKEGYRFDGWYMDGDQEPFDYTKTPITLSIRLTARWSAVMHKVSFMPGYEGGSAASISIQHGKKLTDGDMPVLTRPGYELLHWTAREDGSDAPFDYERPVLGDMELTAVWRRVYRVRYFADGQQVYEAEVPEGGYAENPLSVNPALLAEKTGQEFAGWYEKDGDTYFSNPYSFGTEPLYRDLSLYADWKPYYFAVIFDTRGGAFAEEGAERQIVRYGEYAQEPRNPVRDTWTFAGWFLDGEPYRFNSPVTGEITLSAEWTKMCLVRFETPEGGLISSVQVRSGSLLPKPADPVREGCEFKGWSPDPGKQILWDFENTRVSDDITLRAVWLQRISPEVSLENWIYGDTPKVPVVKGIPEGAAVRYRYRREGESEYTETKPREPGTYTIILLVDESDQYAGAEATAVFVILPRAATAVKIEVHELTGVPGELSHLYDTVEGIRRAMMTKMSIHGAPVRAEKTALYDVVMLVSFDEGITWYRATEHYFPAEGIQVTLPYPEGSRGIEDDFAVSHMMTFTSERLGTTAGQIELPAAARTENGLQMILHGLSPAAVSWAGEAETPVSVPQTGDQGEPALWMVLTLIGIACLAALTGRKTIRRKQGE